MPRSHASPRAPHGSALVAVLLFVAAVAALALFPSFVKKPYVLHMGVMLFLAIIQGQAWNVIGGYAGQYSVGHAAYFGMGAYVTMMLLELRQVPPWWGLWAAMAAAMLLSLVIGSITFRLRGPYFVLASIAVAEIIRLATLHFSGFTKGAEGFLLSSIPTLHLFGAEIEFLTKRTFYFTGLGLAVLSVLANWAVQHSKLGYYLQAIREDQDAAHVRSAPRGPIVGKGQITGISRGEVARAEHGGALTHRRPEHPQQRRQKDQRHADGDHPGGERLHARSS
jgi:branched-chain amino acid transport system permease protein